ncbi:MAG: FAD binding domain-containing protein [Polyangiaceae bacterium]|jgi:carbon-monoxide dehydrogenase medium subunit|nr:FAD binding domain-containing protein [Polyangiaceae bacterium]
MISAYHQPEDLQEALDLVARGAVPVAGATGLYTAGFKRDVELVDLTRLGLHGITVTSDRLVLGAAVTLSRLATEDKLPSMQGALLRQVASSIASAPLRNAITLGGNLAYIVYWADMPVVLLALDAQVEVQRFGQQARWIPLASCLEKGKQTWEGGLITRFAVPLRPGHLGFGHHRITRTVSDYAIASACVTLARDGDKASNVRVVVGAITSRATRVAQAESLIEGTTVNDAVVTNVKQAVAQSIAVAPNFRAPADYRREVAAVLVGRALHAAWTLASREDG